MLPVTRQSRLAYRGFTQTILVSGRIHKLYMPVAFRGSHCGSKIDPKINKPSARVQNSAALRLSVIKVGKLDASSRTNYLLQKQPSFCRRNYVVPRVHETSSIHSLQIQGLWRVGFEVSCALPCLLEWLPSSLPFPTSVLAARHELPNPSSDLASEVQSSSHMHSRVASPV